MKKINAIVIGLLMLVTVSLDVKAIEMPNVISPGRANQTTKTDKNAANEAYRKEYQAEIEAQQIKLNTVKAYDRTARVDLANVLLPAEKIKEIRGLSDEEFDEALNKELIGTLSAETFIQDYAEFSKEKKDAYIKAATEIQIADNRYKNVSNELTAPLKAIVDGKVSVISTRDELKNAGAMIFGIKKNLSTNSDLKRAIHKVNKQNNIIIVVPANEQVIYPRNGVVGSINYSLNMINTEVNKANKTLALVLYTKEQQQSMAAIQNNPALSAEERNTELRAKAKEYFEANQANGTIKNSINSLQPKQKEEFINAAGIVIGAVKEYGALGMACTKLGFNISKNPLLAAPLTFELGALKDTAGLIKDGSSNLAKSVSQLKKVLKDNNISIANTRSSKTTAVKTNRFKKLKI